MKEISIHSESLAKGLNVAWLTEMYIKDYLESRELELSSPEISDYLITAKDGSSRRVGGLYLNIGVEVASIYLIWVEEVSRNLGVGRAMYLEAERLARLHKQSQMIVSNYDFQKSDGFWQRLGFKKCADIRDVPKNAQLLSFLKYL